MIPTEGFCQPEVIPPDGGYELTEDLAFIKKKVLPALFSHPYIPPFRSPVNAKAEGIYPDYFKVCSFSGLSSAAELSPLSNFLGRN